MAQLQGGYERLELALCPHDDDVLVVGGILGKHAQVQAGAGTAGVFDDHRGTVQDVGCLAAVVFVQMVHPLAARRKHALCGLPEDEFHEVEVVAALFNQGAARVGVEAVPVTHLGVEGLAVFADGHLVQRADTALVRDADHFSHGRHVAVFLRDPDDGFAPLGFLHKVVAVGHCGAQRLFDQQVCVSRQCMTHDGSMGEVGGGNDHGVAKT